MPSKLYDTATTRTPEEPTSRSASDRLLISTFRARTSEFAPGPSTSVPRGRARADVPLSCRDVMCGKLFCQNGLANPNYGRLARFAQCKASFYDDHTKDYGQVDAGSRCDEGKVSARVDR